MKKKQSFFFLLEIFSVFFFQKTLTYRCDDAICDALELCLAFADVGGETSTSEIERIADGVGDGAGETTAEQFGGRRLPELRLRVVVREHVVDEIVERQRRTLLRRIAQAVDEIAAPEGQHALLGVHTSKAVENARVTRHLAADDFRVRVLRLHQQFHTLHRRHDGLGNGANRTTIFLTFFFVTCHSKKTKRSKKNEKKKQRKFANGNFFSFISCFFYENAKKPTERKKDDGTNERTERINSLYILHLPTNQQVGAELLEFARLWLLRIAARLWLLLATLGSGRFLLGASSSSVTSDNSLCLYFLNFLFVFVIGSHLGSVKMHDCQKTKTKMLKKSNKSFSKQRMKIIILKKLIRQE